MKGKIIIAGALALLLAGILFMAWDLFFKKPASPTNPYDYNLESLRSGDSSKVLYEEIQPYTSRLDAIHGIAVDHSDRIYIAGENGVEILGPSGKPEKHFALGGKAGCIHVARAGMIYLGMTDHVETFDQEGNQVKKWNSCGDRAVITSIAVTGESVFIADAGNKVVYQYDLSGVLQNKIGEKDPARKIPGFVIPSPYFDLGIGMRGELWVVNPGRHKFEQYDEEGDLAQTWGESSMTTEGFCGCCNPSNFGFLSDGSFVTTEKGIERIKIYGPDGLFRGLVAGPEAFIEGTTGLDVTVDSKNRILVLDPEKKQVRVFVSKSEKPV